MLTATIPSSTSNKVDHPATLEYTNILTEPESRKTILGNRIFDGLFIFRSDLPYYECWQLLGTPDLFSQFEKIFDSIMQYNIVIPKYEMQQSLGIFDLSSQLEVTLGRIMQYEIAIQEPPEIREYLLWHSDILNILPSICKIARERFSSDTQLSLELYIDPEIDDKYPILFVRQENYDDSILDMIDNISSIFEEELNRMSGWFLITTDFQPPMRK